MLSSVRSDLRVNLAPGQGIEPLALGLGPELPEEVRGWGNSGHVVLNAHDNDGRFAAAVYQEALVLLLRPFHDLPELRAGGKCRNDFRHGCVLFRDNLTSFRRD